MQVDQQSPQDHTEEAATAGTRRRRRALTVGRRRVPLVALGLVGALATMAAVAAVVVQKPDRQVTVSAQEGLPQVTTEVTTTSVPVLHDVAYDCPETPGGGGPSNTGHGTSDYPPGAGHPTPQAALASYVRSAFPKATVEEFLPTKWEPYEVDFSNGKAELGLAYTGSGWVVDGMTYCMTWSRQVAP